MSTVTITTALPHGFSIGDVVCFEDIEWILLSVTGLQPEDQLNDECWCVATVPSSTSFTIVIPERSTKIVYFDDKNSLLQSWGFDGEDWTQIGNSFDVGISAGDYVVVTGLSSATWDADVTKLRIAHVDGERDKLTTYEFDGTDWAQVGNSLLLGGDHTQMTLTALSPTRVVYLDGGSIEKLTTYDFDGTDWAQVGNALALTPNIAVPVIAAMSSPLTLVEGTYAESNSSSETFGDGTFEERHIGLKFTNTDEGQVANVKIDLSSVTSAFDAVAAIYANNSGQPGSQVGGNSDAKTLDTVGEVTFEWSSSHPTLSKGTVYWVVISDTTGGTVKVSTVADQGTLFESGKHDTITSIDDQSTGFPASKDWRIGVNKQERIAWMEGLSDELRAYDFDGSDWTLTGNPFSLNVPGGPALTALTATRIATIPQGTTDGQLRTYDFDGTDWTLIAATQISATPAHLTKATLSTMSKGRVTLGDGGNNSLQYALSTYDFDGDVWTLVGNRTVIHSVSGFIPTQTSYVAVGDAPDTTGWTAYLSNGVIRKNVTSVSGIIGLDGEAVTVVSDGNISTNVTITDGTIEFGFAGGRIHWGLPYVSDLETLNITQGEPSASQNKIKSVARVMIRFFKSIDSLFVGPNKNALTAMTPAVSGELVGNGEDEDQEIYVQPEWNNNGRLFIRQTAPSPFTIIAIVPEFETEDDKTGGF